MKLIDSVKLNIDTPIPTVTYSGVLPITILDDVKSCKAYSEEEYQLFIGKLFLEQLIEQIKINQQ